MTATDTRAPARPELPLQVVSACLAVVSLGLVVLPDAGAAAFSLVVHQQRDFPPGFSDEALAYVRLAHAVLGAVMAGWFVLLCLLSRLASTDRRVWAACAASVAVWFVPDTAYSLLSGFWENAVLNTGALLLLVPALLACRPR